MSSSLVNDMQALFLGALALVAGGLVIGCILGAAVASWRTTSNRDKAWDAHEIQARRIAHNIQPPINS